ncbi:hypothetical protein C0V76_00640 [Uliginosibacterium sp. TH139]|nr:hypothetical protein C0V76_00640 [Uliginosibacterium sp. TH139]
MGLQVKIAQDDSKHPLAAGNKKNCGGISMYNIVFSGRLLDGHAPEKVQAAVAKRLGLNPPQVERLFSGRKVVLKKGVTEESAKLYLSVLHGLGMNAGMARIARGNASVQALATFKVVFWGRTLDGFTRAAVMQAAAARLKLNPAQIVRIFDGSKAVLKRGVSSDVGSRYVVELARIGMQIDLEVETEAPAVVNAAAPVPRKTSEDPYAGLLQTQFELPGTTDEADEMRPAAPAESAPVMRHVPQPARAAQPIAVPAAKAGSSVIEYVRCGQCGSRQASSTRCTVCGVAMERRAGERRQSQKQIPMDASAYATPTTIMGNMPEGLVRHSAAVARRSTPSLREELHHQPPVSTAVRQRFIDEQKSKLLGLTLLVIAGIWLIW